jgi:hypothetical protein
MEIGMITMIDWTEIERRVRAGDAHNISTLPESAHVANGRFRSASKRPVRLEVCCPRNS